MYCGGPLYFTVDGCGSIAELCECQHHQLSYCNVLRLMNVKYFDLLIRNSQIAAIAEDISHTGNWEEAPLVRSYGEDYHNRHPASSSERMAPSPSRYGVKKLSASWSTPLLTGVLVMGIS